MECFCGCGRRVKRLPFWMWSANRMGHEIARLQHTLEDETKPDLVRDYPDPDRVLEIVDRTIVDGALHQDDIRDVVHGDVDYEDVDWREVRVWGTYADGMASWMRASPEVRQWVVDRYG